MLRWNTGLVVAMVVSTALTTTALTTTAQAGECESPYTIDDLLTDLAMTEGALRGGDNAGASENGTRLGERLPCSDDILPGAMAARIYRAIGGGVFVGGDPDGGLLWLRTAAELEPEFEYAAGDLPADHPVRSGLKLAKVEVMGTGPERMVDAQEFGIGKHFLDGRPIEVPEASVERNHLYQRVLDETYTFLVEGNAFPPEAFGAVKPAEEVPDDPVVTDVKLPDAVVVKQKAWPAERVVLVSAGAASLAASGALYGLSAGTRANFDASNTVEDMDKYQSSTNTLVIASGATGAAGVGMLGFGVLFFIVDGDPRPTLDFRF